MVTKKYKIITKLAAHYDIIMSLGYQLKSLLINNIQNDKVTIYMSLIGSHYIIIASKMLS